METSELAGTIFGIVLLLFFFVIIPGIVVGITVPVNIYRHRYTDFVNEHSVALRKIRAINNKYSFNKIPNYDMEHSYDNNDFYPNVSCKDYLTYQLVYLQGKISKVLRDTLENKINFESYKKEISSCHYGEYDVDISLYDVNPKTLARFEKRIIKPLIISPKTRFFITVTLRRTDINGNYQEGKRQTFEAEDIKDIIRRLNQKRGERYLNDDIWQSLVRVERAKVSNKMRFAVFARDHERCVKCGSRHNLEVDHIYPISKGGKTEMRNLQTLCHRCNVKKGNSME